MCYKKSDNDSASKGINFKNMMCKFGEIQYVMPEIDDIDEI